MPIFNEVIEAKKLDPNGGFVANIEDVTPEMDVYIGGILTWDRSEESERQMILLINAGGTVVTQFGCFIDVIHNRSALLELENGVAEYVIRGGMYVRYPKHDYSQRDVGH